MPERVHVFISGRVQGVGFRASTRREAKELGVEGWVKNLSDGRVEAIFEGDEESVEEMVEWSKEGSRTARVEEVDVSREKYRDDFEKFEVRF